MSILVTNNNATQEGYEKESAEVMAEETSSIQLQHYQKKCRSQERLKRQRMRTFRHTLLFLTTAELKFIFFLWEAELKQ